MYILLVRRIQLYMDDELDDARSAEVARLGVSRSALVRDAVRVSLSAYFDTPADAVDDLIGWLDVDPDKDIDSVVYGLESEIRRHIILDRASGARDLRHVDAVRLWRTDRGPVRTSNLVLGETWAWIRRRVDHRAAVRFLEGLGQSRRVSVVVVDETIDRQAWGWLRRHDERHYSYVDATSFAIMRRERIAEALAFDGDFTAAGFVEVRPRR